MMEATTMQTVSRRVILAAPAALVGGRAAAQQGWPTRPLRVINPWPPGGPADIICRPLTQKLSESLGQTVVMENRPGANGTIGANLVARAAPDGYTLFFSHVGPISISPVFATNLPYDPLRDFAPITQGLSVPQIIAVAPSLGVRSLADLVALARARPGALAFGSSGIGSSLHMAGELLKLRAGIDMTHIPYSGAAPAVTDLIAGRIQVLIADFPALLGQVQAGTLPALAVTSAERLDVLPAVPTAVEAGVPGMRSENWYGLLAPAATPPERIAILHDAARAALEDEATRQLLVERGGLVVGSSPADFGAFIRTTHASWGEVVRATGVRLE
jgi:tripartite-type tricarboxylate transporter receptor subunit TctC